MELQKLPLMATKEQLRLAELTQSGRDVSNTTDDIASQKRVKKVVELTNCTVSEAEVALIDCEGSVEAAVALLLDKPDKLVLWSQQGKTRKPKSTSITTNAPNKIGRKKESQKGRFRKDEFKNTTTSQNTTTNYNSSTNQNFATTQHYGNNDEWKSGPRVFMPSSMNIVAANGTNTTSATATSSWPTIENTTVPVVNESLQQKATQQKTFAAVAAMKKISLKQPSAEPNEYSQSSSINKPFDDQQNMHTMTDVKETEEAVNEWSSSVDWGASISPPPVQPTSAAMQSELSVPPPESFGASAQSLSVNQQYTDQLKNAIGLVQTNQASNQILSQIDTPDLTEADYSQQQISHIPPSLPDDVSELARKVEFATRDLPSAVTNMMNYQFGFQFNEREEIPSATSLGGDPWTNQHISSVELDRSMLNNSAVNVLSTMKNIPTTSSAVTANFSTASQQSQDYQRNTSSHSTSLSFTDTASVNFPPANGGSNLGPQSVSNNHQPPTNVTTTQQQLKPVYSTANPSMMTASQHIQQQPQTLYHQAPAPTAVPQFPSYNMNMPYMYSPVAAAPTMPGTAEIDRLFLQYGAPYNSLDMQLGAMSLGPATTLAPSHRTPLDSFMDNKFGPQQQTGGGGYQHNQSTQQQRTHGQSDNTTAMMGGGGHVAPPPGFGMPTAPTQQSYMPQPANLQSLFQMPTYHHPSMSYQQHQFMMSNANRFTTSQRPTQTSPPEGNGLQQRRHDVRGNDTQGYPGTDSVEHSTGGGAGQQSYVNVNNFNKYRSYM